MPERSTKRAKSSKRDWQGPRAKVESEGRCRVCGAPNPEAAHIIPRSRVAPGIGEDARNIVPLCGFGGCHARFDSGDLDLLPYLTRDEMAYAVELVGLFEAFKRLTNSRVPL